MLATPLAAEAAPAEVVIEIQPRAEQLLDARATRRLMALELADVEVLPAAEGRVPALFYRVLAVDAALVRVELWERGELHDARLVSSAQGSPQLVSRRVALAAAELARGLRQKRLVGRRQAARERERELLRARVLAERTREGPLALRSEVAALFGSEFALFGSALTTEITLAGATRLDLGARASAGSERDSVARLSLFELALGPARRLRLGPALDLDAGVLASVGLAHVGGATRVDDIDGQRATWSARALVSLRVEPRLSRGLRGSMGFEAAALLRPIPASFGADDVRYSGIFAGVSFGVVVTPRSSTASR